ncbi:MAG: phage baseplate assembly protein V [Ardenticatenaceae bacterium]|nr:phage baseplate assembly protein V [Ardenticatenaceae bacterium]
MPQFFGKYRGTVVNNIDPQQTGRVQINCPAVLGSGSLSWAMPNVPLSGSQSGIYCVPIVGAKVWVEFEGGNPDYPIYTGGFWGTAAEVPPLALTGLPASPSIVLQTSGQNTISISDVPGAGGLMLRAASGAMIVVNETGITISNGQGAMITLTGPTVDINGGALTIV